MGNLWKSKQYAESAGENFLTMASSGEEGHPVDSNRNGAMLIVEMVHMVRGT